MMTYSLLLEVLVLAELINHETLEFVRVRHGCGILCGYTVRQEFNVYINQTSDL